jgi:hypothetical protein
MRTLLMTGAALILSATATAALPLVGHGPSIASPPFTLAHHKPGHAGGPPGSRPGPGFTPPPAVVTQPPVVQQPIIERRVVRPTYDYDDDELVVVRRPRYRERVYYGRPRCRVVVTRRINRFGERVEVRRRLCR